MRRCALQGEGEIYMRDVFTVARKKRNSEQLEQFDAQEIQEQKIVKRRQEVDSVWPWVAQADDKILSVGQECNNLKQSEPTRILSHR